MRMKLTKRILALLSLVIFAVPSYAAEPVGSLVAYTSVSPVASVMQRVGAGRWEVRSIVEAGKDPHTFTLTPRTAAELSAAKVYVAVGIEMDPVVTSRAPESLLVVNVVLPPEVAENSGDDHADVEDEDDPHVWLDPEGLIATARATSGAYIAVDPDHKADYAAALSRFEADVAAASAKVVKILTPYKGRRFFVQHDAFTRYAAHFGSYKLLLRNMKKSRPACVWPK